MNSTITNNRLKNILYFFCGIVLILLFLQISSLIVNDKLVFPNVFDILKSFFNLFSKGEVYVSIFHTLLELLISLIIASIIGIGLGVLGGLFTPFRKIINPLMIALRSIPMIVVTIIFIILFKRRIVPIITTTLMIMPLFYESTKEGIVHIDSDLLDVYKLYSNINLKVIFKVYLPLIIGYTKQAFINSIGMGFKVIITCEYLVGVANTLGYTLYSSYIVLYQYENIYAYGLLIIFIILLVEAIPYFIAYIFNIIKNKIQKNKQIYRLKSDL